MKEVCGTRFRRKEGKKKANQLKKGSSKKERTRESSKEWMKEERWDEIKRGRKKNKETKKWHMKRRNDLRNEGLERI